MGRPPHEQYTHSHHPVVLAAHARRTAEEAAAFLIPHLEPGMEILDLGCGPGSITVGLARYVAPSGVIGVDRAPEALDHARQHAAEAQLGNVVFQQADVYELPFDDGAFHVVYAHQLLQHLADPVAALREAFRVLRPGGYVAVRDADYGTMTHHPHDPVIDRWLEMYHAVARANGGEPDAGRRVMEWVQAAGYVHVHPTTSTWVFATPDERAWWADLWIGRNDPDGAAGAGVTPFAARMQEIGAGTPDDLGAIRDAFRRWAAHPDGWFAFIHGEALGQKP
jgi:ubiquinone/menaquinone biosynthesis C-methylase UbiE